MAYLSNIVSMRSQQLTTIEELIVRNQSKEAALQLRELLSEGPADLRQVSIAQLSRLQELTHRQNMGTLSMDEYNQEKAKIHMALLSVVKELKSHEKEAEKVHLFPTRMKPIGIILGIVAVAILSWFLTRAIPTGGSTLPGHEPTSFNLTLYLQDENGLNQGFEEADWQVVLGSYRLTQQPADAQGKLVFEEIPSQYRKDSVRLIPQDVRFTVINQSGYIASQEKISFTIAARATILRGTVYEGNKRVPHAIIEIESGLTTTMTDKAGNFTCTVPKAMGTRVQIKVLVDGTERANQVYRLQAEKPLAISLN